MTTVNANPNCSRTTAAIPTGKRMRLVSQPKLELMRLPRRVSRIFFRDDGETRNISVVNAELIVVGAYTVSRRYDKPHPGPIAAYLSCCGKNTA